MTAAQRTAARGSKYRASRQETSKVGRRGEEEQARNHCMDACVKKNGDVRQLGADAKRAQLRCPSAKSEGSTRARDRCHSQLAHSPAEERGVSAEAFGPSSYEDFALSFSSAAGVATFFSKAGGAATAAATGFAAGHCAFTSMKLVIMPATPTSAS